MAVTYVILRIWKDSDSISTETLIAAQAITEGS